MGMGLISESNTEFTAQELVHTLSDISARFSKGSFGKEASSMIDKLGKVTKLGRKEGFDFVFGQAFKQAKVLLDQKRTVKVR